MKLYFQDTNTPAGRRVSDTIITKEGRKWIYFTATINRCGYRVDKETGEVQIAPYWKTGKDMFVKF